MTFFIRNGLFGAHENWSGRGGYWPVWLQRNHGGAGEQQISTKKPSHFTSMSTKQTVMGLATVLPKGDRGEVGRPGRQGITGPPVMIG